MRKPTTQAARRVRRPQETRGKAGGPKGTKAGPTAPGATPDVRLARLEEMRPDPRNANKGTERGRGMVEASLRQDGAGRSVLLDRNGLLIAGNKTHEAAVDIGLDGAIIVKTDGRRLVAVQRTDLDLLKDPQAARLAIADNRTAEVGLAWDAEILQDLAKDGVPLDTLWGEDELLRLLAPPNEGAASGALIAKFGVPPFTILDARQGYWRDRKRAWLSLGIKSEIGRGEGLTYNPNMALDGVWDARRTKEVAEAINAERPARKKAR